MVVDDTLTALIQSAGMPLGGGAILGFASGYALKEIAKFIALALGVLALLLGFLEYQRWISVNWITVENQTSSLMTHAAHKTYTITQQMGHEIPIGLGLIGFLPGLAICFSKG
jgi:uncharacterized membrane protein (Fun14 family)